MGLDPAKWERYRHPSVAPMRARKSEGTGFHMKRIETAIQGGRCILGLGKRALSDPEVLDAIQNRPGLACFSIGSETPKPFQALSAEALQSVTSAEGGVLVLLDPDTSADADGLKVLDELLGAATHRPRLVMVTRAFNPFMLPGRLRMMKIQQIKDRARDFVSALPGEEGAATAMDVGLGFASLRPSAPAPEKAQEEAPEPAQVRAPQAVFVGRGKETLALQEAISEGGTVVVHGPEGIGKTWLLERVFSGEEGPSKNTRVHLEQGAGYDTLATRIAEWVGGAALPAAQGDERPIPRKAAVALAGALDADDKPGEVLVISGLETLLRRDGTFLKDDRLALLVGALLGRGTGASVVFLSTLLPAFGTGSVKSVEIGGLAREDLPELMASLRVEGIDSHLDEIHARTHGHPMGVRALAVAWNERGEVCLEKKKFLRLAHVGDLERLKAQLKNQVDGLSQSERKALALAAHSTDPLPATVLSEMGVRRKDRLVLLAAGLLDSTASSENRCYCVHPLVSRRMSRKECTGFDLLEQLAENKRTAANQAEGLEKLALSQQANRIFIAARQGRKRLSMKVPDGDALVPALREMGKTRRMDLAASVSKEALEKDPYNTELRLVRAELMIADGAEHKRVSSWYAETARMCPTPEVFHHEATWCQNAKGSAGKRGRSSAIKALERGVGRFPKNGRILRRLAGLKLQEGHMEQAEALARQSLDVQPEMLDGLSLLGSILHQRHGPPWTEAEECLRKAVEGDPGGALVAARLGRLLRHKGMVDAENRTTLWREAEALLTRGTLHDGRNVAAGLELALLSVDRGQLGEEIDLEKTEALLRRAIKADRNSRSAQLALVRVLARTDRVEEASKRLQKHLSAEGGFQAQAVLGELFAFQGRIFRAEKEFRLAWQQAPDGAPERELIRLELQRLEDLINSGAAVDIEKQAEGVALVEPLVRDVDAGPRREAGKTVVRRKRKGAKKEEAVAAEEAAPAEEAVAAEEAAPAEEAVAAEEAAPAEEPSEEAEATSDDVPNASA